MKRAPPVWVDDMPSVAHFGDGLASGCAALGASWSRPCSAAAGGLDAAGRATSSRPRLLSSTARSIAATSLRSVARKGRLDGAAGRRGVERGGSPGPA